MVGGLEFIFLLSSLMGGQGSELLNYVQTAAYWQAQDERIVDVATMSTVLADTEERPASDKLMAIRALGELGMAEGADKQAVLKLLEPLVDSNEPFVGHYARRSIAWIKGEDPPAAAKPTTAQLDSDLALLPRSSQIVAQMRMGGDAGTIDIADLLPDIGAMAGPEGDEMKKQMLNEANKVLVEAALMLGNARIDAVTLGLHFTGNGDNGYAAIVFRGQYDRISAQIAIEDLAERENQELKLYSIGEVEVVAPANENEVALLMPSDEVAVLVFGEPDDGVLPIESIAKAFTDNNRKHAFQGAVAEQIKQIDRGGVDLWLAMEPTGPMVTELSEVFGAYKAGHATATRSEDGSFDIRWRAEGRDEASVTESVQFMTGGIAEGIAGMKEMMGQAPEMKAMFEPMLKMMESIKVEQDGKTMTGEMQLDPKIMMSPFMMFSHELQGF